MREQDFNSVSALVEKLIGQKGEYVITGRVIKRDEIRKLVWIAEFGDQAIPLIGFDYTVKYYDTDENGVVNQKNAKIEIKVPKLGQTVVVLRELGTRRLPRCVGVLTGQEWMTRTED